MRLLVAGSANGRLLRWDGFLGKIEAVGEAKRVHLVDYKQFMKVEDSKKKK